MDKSITDYTSSYLDDYGFEREMVRYRRTLVVDRLRSLSPRHVVEVGCGSEFQVVEYQSAGGTWDSWAVVEPSKKFADLARQLTVPNFEVIEAFFEQASGRLTNKPDVLICSGVLHEVPNSQEFISSLTAAMGPDTVLHINVPNANSLHRRLAKAMGLISDVREASERNKELQQPRVYDLEVLTKSLEAQGLSICNSGGYFVKPFTHRQMESLLDIIDPDVFGGLYQLGLEYPEWASEIFVEAKLS